MPHALPCDLKHAGRDCKVPAMPRLLGNVMEWIQNGDHDNDIATQPAGTCLISWKTRTVIMDIRICYAARDRANLLGEEARGSARVNGRFAPTVTA